MAVQSFELFDKTEIVYRKFYTFLLYIFVRICNGTEVQANLVFILVVCADIYLLHIRRNNFLRGGNESTRSFTYYTVSNTSNLGRYSIVGASLENNVKSIN